MLYHVFLSSISIFSIMISLSKSDFDLNWPWTDDTPFSNEATSSDLALLPLDSTTSLFDNTPSSGNFDLGFSNPDTFDGSLFENTANDIASPDEIDDSLISDEPSGNSLFDLSDDCLSSSPTLPYFDKARVRRRRDGYGTCATNFNSPTLIATNDANIDNFDIKKSPLFADPVLQRVLSTPPANRNENAGCYWATGNTLPWGICASSDPSDTISRVHQIRMLKPKLGVFMSYELKDSFRGKHRVIFFSLPHGKKFLILILRGSEWSSPKQKTNSLYQHSSPPSLLKFPADIFIPRGNFFSQLQNTQHIVPLQPMISHCATSFAVDSGRNPLQTVVVVMRICVLLSVIFIMRLGILAKKLDNDQMNEWMNRFDVEYSQIWWEKNTFWTRRMGRIGEGRWAG